MLAYISACSGVIGFKVGTWLCPVREKVRPARPDVCVSAKKFAPHAQNGRKRCFQARWANFFAEMPLEGPRWANFFAGKLLEAPRRANFVAHAGAPAKRPTGTHPSNASNCCSGHNPSCNHP